MGTLPLFDEPGGFDRERLRDRLAEQARAGIFIGTSSWKYEGWFGQIYTRERYLSRGRFSQRRFEQECLAEYAEVFPVVCGDFSFYQFPSEDYWRRLFTSAPATLRYAFKVPEELTVKQFPSHPRYGPRGGAGNPSFLDASLFDGSFLEPLRPWRGQIAALILEFGQFPRQCYRNVTEFMEELEPFLAALPADFRYAVEVRNEEFLAPEYFACLRQRRVAHVFNEWTRMPEIGLQMEFPQARTTNFSVARALLRPGRPYEQAVERFRPYDRIQEPHSPAREALRDLMAQARERNEPAYIFVNNRLEGNAPGTIESLIG